MRSHSPRYRAMASADGVTLRAVPAGLTSPQVRRIVSIVALSADVVGLTIAEFFPRQVMHLQQVLHDFPLIARH
jgi:arginase